MQDDPLWSSFLIDESEAPFYVGKEGTLPEPDSNGHTWVHITQMDFRLWGNSFYLQVCMKLKF